MIVVVDERLDLGLEVLREEIILQQNTVLQGIERYPLGSTLEGGLPHY